MENPFNKQFNRLNTIQQHIQYINYTSDPKYFDQRGGTLLRTFIEKLQNQMIEITSIFKLLFTNS